jgi:hypothetical protein
MKKYLLILVTSLGLVSCVGNGSPNMAVNKFGYDGHNYIVFEKGILRSSQDYAMSVVHDPDCPCHQKVLKE